MPRTTIDGEQVLDGTIEVSDLNSVAVSSFILGNIVTGGDIESSSVNPDGTLNLLA